MPSTLLMDLLYPHKREWESDSQENNARKETFVFLEGRFKQLG
jgi:hypothetical protein